MCVIEKYVVWRNARAAHGPLNAFLHRPRGRSASGTLMLFYNFNFACASRAYLQVAKKNTIQKYANLSKVTYKYGKNI